MPLPAWHPPFSSLLSFHGVWAPKPFFYWLEWKFVIFAVSVENPPLFGGTKAWFTKGTVVGTPNGFFLALIVFFFRNFKKGALEKGHLHKLVRNWLSNTRQICRQFCAPFLWCTKRNTLNFAQNLRAICDKFAQRPSRERPPSRDFWFFLALIQAYPCQHWWEVTDWPGRDSPSIL